MLKKRNKPIKKKTWRVGKRGPAQARGRGAPRMRGKAEPRLSLSLEP